MKNRTDLPLHDTRSEYTMGSLLYQGFSDMPQGRQNVYKIPNYDSWDLYFFWAIIAYISILLSLYFVTPPWYDLTLGPGLERSSK